MTVAAALLAIARHPIRFVRSRWNWKAAALSACMRGTIFFAATIAGGVTTAARALMVDAAFRIPVAGVCAAVIQEVRWAEPMWASAAVALIGVPASAHAIEITVHSVAGTPSIWRGVVASVALSIVSSAVELVLMRHHILLVGQEGGSLASDVRRLLRLIGVRST